MEATLAAPTFDVRGIINPTGSLAALSINGKVRESFRRGNVRRLYVADRHVFKVGYQSIEEARLSRKLCKASPHFWPIVAHGLLGAPSRTSWGWVAQEILPLRRALLQYDWEDWCRAWDTIQAVAEEFHITDIDLDRYPDGEPRPHNWTIWRDTPVIYDFAT